MSKEERDNPDSLNSYGEPKPDKKGRNIVITITIPTAFIVAIIFLWLKYIKKNSTDTPDYQNYLSQVELLLTERLSHLPDTVVEYTNNKFVLDYMLNSIIPYGREGIKENWTILRNDLFRVANERHVELPPLPDAYAQ